NPLIPRFIWGGGGISLEMAPLNPPLECSTVIRWWLIVPNLTAPQREFVHSANSLLKAPQLIAPQNWSSAYSANTIG
ncbi:hypothetical protein J6590_094344, partial [Homalodisca vitripennis]